MSCKVMGNDQPGKQGPYQFVLANSRCFLDCVEPEPGPPATGCAFWICIQSLRALVS